MILIWSFADPINPQVCSELQFRPTYKSQLLMAEYQQVDFNTNFKNKFNCCLMKP